MFDPQTYSQRRQKLAESVGGGVVLLLGHSHSPMNYADNYYPFRQDSTFLYYIGLDQPDLAAVIDTDSGRTTVFGHPPTVDDVIWSGPQRSLNQLAQLTGADLAAPIRSLQRSLDRAKKQVRPVHFFRPCRAATGNWLTALLGPDAEGGVSGELIAAIVAQRLIKEPQEVAEIESALEVTARMHIDAMRLAAPGIVEGVIAGHVESLAIAHGARLAYPCIFTRHGEVLHNHSYHHKLKAGDLVVHDSGASSRRHYASDITRTIPVSGPFNERQRTVYHAVLTALEGAMEQIRPGIRYRDIHLDAARSITCSLQQAGLMKGDLEESVAEGAHGLFFPHGLGHMMGLDVHDMENLGEDRVGYDTDTQRVNQFGLRSLRLGKFLESGHVLTVEPGCYFIEALIDQWQQQKRHERFINYAEVRRWCGLGGVRIEENVVVTPDGHRILGPPIPRSVEDVECACQTELN
ncbi:MAG: aminopeptidase P family protein [Bacteroidota bacterium]|nr:aminopeptidase P family protein [Bacteroidota bacterium]MDE2957954.1 aminopeptidase P family protein [Bacteroidota bacterium]